MTTVIRAPVAVGEVEGLIRSFERTLGVANKNRYGGGLAPPTVPSLQPAVHVAT